MSPPTPLKSTSPSTDGQPIERLMLVGPRPRREELFRVIRIAAE